MPSKMKSLAQKLRREQTPPEKLLWSALRNHALGYAFRRQQPLGNYIVDFICFEQKLIIEVDGEFHGLAEQALRDQIRQTWLEDSGYRVLRFAAKDVMGNVEGVVYVIKMVLSAREYPPP
jgi:very-short-patch-repair endonuclease